MSEFIEWSKIVENSIGSAVVKIEFEKKDGTVRTMICTTAHDLIPENKLPIGDGTKTYNTTTVKRVFDVENQEWRSINKDKLISCQIV